MAAPEPALDAASNNITKRYRHAYRVAKLVALVSALVRVTGGVLFGLCAIYAALVRQSALGDHAPQAVSGPSATGSLVFVLLCGGAAAGLVVYGFGTALAAMGEMLKATLDTAVNTSPFLDNAQRALTLGLPVA